MDLRGKIKSKADYIADVVINMLAVGELLPDNVGEDILRSLSNIADLLDEYHNFDCND